MRKTVVDFLEEHQEGFDELAFTPVDSIAFSTLSYFDFDEYAYGDPSGAEPIPLIDLIRYIPLSRIATLPWLVEDSSLASFVEAVARSRRYHGATLRFFRKEDSPVIEKQFCACLFELPGLAYVAFRGTDGSLTGWKEDFNLCFQDVIPSQLSAAHYLNAVSCEIAPEARLYVGGHSKGGNLAEYAVACCTDECFARIEAAFDHDGPSFLVSPSPRFGSQAFNERMRKSVPASSIFGLILEKGRSFQVVDSKAAGIFQHNPLSWLVEGEDLSYQEGLNASSLVINETLNSWLSRCSLEERALFVNTAFSLLSSGEADSWKDAAGNLFENLRAALKDGAGMDRDTREGMQKTLQSLKTAIGEVARRRVKEAAASPRNAIESQAELRAAAIRPALEAEKDGKQG